VKSQRGSARRHQLQRPILAAVGDCDFLPCDLGEAVAVAVEPAVGGYERVLELVDHPLAASGVEANFG